jgi:hypothetical protein
MLGSLFRKVRVQYWDSVVCIATRYGLEGLWIDSQWGGEIFLNSPDRPWDAPSLIYRDFPGGNVAGAWS